MNLSDSLKKHHITLQKKYGQNFIGDPALLERIASVCDWQEDDRVLEIGPGAGTLTCALAARAKEVLTIEIDRRLEPLLAETLAPCPNVQLIFGDALSSDLDALMYEKLSWNGRYKIVANLPYYITTPLIMHALEDAHNVSEIVIMVQKEVGERLCASPGTKSYGAITVMVQYAAAVSRAFDVSRKAFIPAPEVDSTILHLKPYQKRPLQAQSDAMLRRVVKAAFSQRRKTLRNSLQALGVDKACILKALQSADISGERRAETLSVAEFVSLADAFYEGGS